MDHHFDRRLRGVQRYRRLGAADLNAATRRTRARRNGFTLLELLVVVAVIAILLAIGLVTLSSVLSSGSETKSLSNTRQLATIIDAFATESDSRYPAFEPGVMYPAFDDSDLMFSYPYWQIYSHWSGVVYDLLPYDEHIEVYVSPGSARFSEPGGLPFPSSYEYSTSFAGQPNLWTTGATADEGLRTPARQDQVASPSQKALLWDGELGWVEERDFRNDRDEITIPAPTAFADGSASLRIQAEASEPIDNPFGPAVGNERLHNTERGVDGRDF